MMASSSKTTTDHDEIREWVEARNGKPTTVEGTSKRGEDAGLLRIDFPTGASNPPLEPISWDDFFEKFDEAKLAFIYQDQKSNGEGSTFCKFVDRKSVDLK
jgi:hypothetical protein